MLKHLIYRPSTTASKISSETANIAVTSSTSSRVQAKWVVNLSKKELTPEEKSLPKKSSKFAVTQASIPIKEYISTTTVAVFQAGELNGIDCSDLYDNVSIILNSYITKPMHTNITKAEHLALENGMNTTCLEHCSTWQRCGPGCNG